MRADRYEYASFTTARNPARHVTPRAVRRVNLAALAVRLAPLAALAACLAYAFR